MQKKSNEYPVYRVNSEKQLRHQNQQMNQNTHHIPKSNFKFNPDSQYNILSQQSQKQQLRGSTSMGAEAQLQKKLQQKLTDIESRIQEMKTNIYRKKLQRKKIDIERNQQLMKLEKYRKDSLGNSKFITGSLVSRQVEKDGSSTQKWNKNQLSEGNCRDLIKDEQQQLKYVQNTDKIHKQDQTIPEQKKNEQEQQDISGMMQQTLNGFVTHIPESNSRILTENPYSARSIYYVSQIIKGYQDKKSLMWQHIRTSIFLFNYFSNVRMPSNLQVSKRAVNLPRRVGYQNKKTVIFDLDQTLIHCNQNLKMGHQIELPVIFPNGQTIMAGINIRPGVIELLESLYRKFQLVIFTASHKCYANVVIDYLDPERKFVQHRLYREHCFVTSKGEYVKDLRILNRELKDIVLVDNAAYSYAFQAENGIPIIPYFNGDTDYQLKMLQTYLTKLQFCTDVRILNRTTFKLTQYRDYKPNKVQELVEDLYLKN